MQRFSLWRLAALLLATGLWGAPSAKCGDAADRDVVVILVYEFDPEFMREAKQPPDKILVDKVVAALDLRVNPSFASKIWKNARVRPIGGGRIEITIFGNDPEKVRRIQSLVARSGTLEFRILANTRDHGAIIEKAKQLGNDPGRTAVMGKDEEGQEVREAWFVPMKLGDTPEDKKRVEGVLSYREIYYRKVKVRAKEVPEVLVVNDRFNVTGQYLTSTTEGIDRLGKPCVNFRFNSRGSQLFAGLTGSNLPEQGGQLTRKLGIILDGMLNSAPSIQSTISDRGEITGNFTKQEVEDLVAVLNAGSLPAKLKPEPVSVMEVTR